MVALVVGSMLRKVKVMVPGSRPGADSSSGHSCVQEGARKRHNNESVYNIFFISLVVSRKYYCIDSVGLYDVVGSDHTAVRAAYRELELHFVVSRR